MSFTLLDLASQAAAVQRLLSGCPEAVKLAWLSQQGTLRPHPRRSAQERQVYFFSSSLGLACAFFLDGEELVFLGDHTTYTVPE